MALVVFCTCAQVCFKYNNNVLNYITFNYDNENDCELTNHHMSCEPSNRLKPILIKYYL